MNYYDQVLSLTANIEYNFEKQICAIFDQVYKYLSSVMKLKTCKNEFNVNQRRLLCDKRKNWMHWDSLIYKKDILEKYDK